MAKYCSGKQNRLYLLILGIAAQHFLRACLRRQASQSLSVGLWPSPIYHIGLYRAPCVGWVVGVWFNFALRCVALLCGVFMRLHLALFPAGGPFLPSLYVNLYNKLPNM
jgi:hypothetical protein